MIKPSFRGYYKRFCWIKVDKHYLAWKRTFDDDVKVQGFKNFKPGNRSGAAKELYQKQQEYALWSVFLHAFQNSLLGIASISSQSVQGKEMIQQAEPDPESLAYVIKI